jgi:hypothetical protein
MFTYLETAIAFTLVMLVASLMVNILVRILDTLTNARAKGVQAMLRQLYRGYLVSLGERPTTGAENAFVHAVLRAPILHSAESFDKLANAPAKPDAATLPRLHSTVQYLLVDDLVAIIRDTDATTVKTWFADPTKVPADAKGDLTAYINKWFKTAAATASNQFGKLARRKAMSVAAIVVVLLNLDAIRLAYDLYLDRSLDDRVSQHVEDMTETANRLLAEHPDPEDTDQLRADLEKTAAMFSVERVPFGWNDSYMSKRWCAYRGACDDPSVPAPSQRQLVMDGLYWLVGLFVAWLLLSLGAPFWVRALETLTGIRDKLKPPRGKAPGSSPWPDDKDDGGTDA